MSKQLSAKAWVAENIDKAVEVLTPFAAVLAEPDAANQIVAVHGLLKDHSPIKQKNILKILGAIVGAAGTVKDAITGKETAKKYCSNCGHPQ